MIPFSDLRTRQDLAAVLAQRVERSPDKAWIVDDEGAHSYREIDERSGRLAQGFSDAGIVAGDTVLVMLPDTVDYILTWCALAKIGAIEVPVNVHYRGSILSYVVNDSLARTMVIDAGYLDRLGFVADQVETVEQLVVLGEPGETKISPGRKFRTLPYRTRLQTQPGTARVRDTAI